jgi:hypothetical protein
MAGQQLEMAASFPHGVRVDVHFFYFSQSTRYCPWDNEQMDKLGKVCGLMAGFRGRNSDGHGGRAIVHKLGFAPQQMLQDG